MPYPSHTIPSSLQLCIKITFCRDFWLSRVKSQWRYLRACCIGVKNTFGTALERHGISAGPKHHQYVKCDGFSPPPLPPFLPFTCFYVTCLLQSKYILSNGNVNSFHTGNVCATQQHFTLFKLEHTRILCGQKWRL